jgi:DNA replication protein DnaC
MSEAPQILLTHHLKALKLPTFLREHDKLARQCAAEGVAHTGYLLRLAELELLDRERRMVERRIRQARFPAVKSLDSFDFAAIPALNKMLVLELARCAYIEQRENVIALGPSGTGKTHIALGLGLAACQKGLSVGFTTAAALVHELLEAREERRLLRLQKQLAAYRLLIVDELGYVPLSPSGAELLFEVFSRRYERGPVIVTSNLPFDEWTSVFSSERLTGALLDRLTHHVHILEMNGESYRLKTSRRRQRQHDTPQTSPDNSRARDGDGHLVGKTRSRVAERATSASPERVEQRLRFPQVRRIKTFGEPAVDGREKFSGFGALALALPQAGEARPGAQLEGPGLLSAGDIEGVTEADLGLDGRTRRGRYRCVGGDGRRVSVIRTAWAGQQQLPLEAMQLRLPHVLIVRHR